ncbi:MAG: hypothetical protein DMG74_17725 [Acidobacteria bacterium]|nr:MAG: hypothetical protein DMG74_17725 [Acidobacteriota bacterium]
MTATVKWTLFAGYVVSSVWALPILKNFLPQVALSARRVSLPSLKIVLWLGFGASLYLLSFGLWLLILRSLPLTTAYPAAVGTTLCGTILVSVFILGENLRLSQGAGIALILVGFVLVFRGN